MRNYLVLFFSITFCSLFSQEKKLFIGVNYSFDDCYRKIVNADGSLYYDAIVSDRNIFEIPSSGYTTGLNAAYKLSTVFGVETGIQYSKRGYETPIFQTGLSDSHKTFYIFNYLDIPLKANFTFGKKKLRFVTSTGIAVSILLSQQNKVNNTVNGQTTSSQWSGTFPLFNFSPFLSAGIAWLPTQKIIVKAEPIYRYSLLTMEEGPIGMYLFNLGLNISCFYAL